MSTPTPPPSYDGTNPYPATQGGEPAKKAKKKWPWIVGILAVLAVIIGVSTGSGDDTVEKTADGGNAVVEENAVTNEIPELKPAEQTGKGKEVVYEVISDSATLNNVTWFDEVSAIQQESNASAPWSLTVHNDSTVVIAGVTAQTDGTSVTCRVTIDGKVETEETATGQYAVVNCTAPAF